MFLIWFPDPFQEMLGGTRLFVILVLCDLGLGPLTSFIIYSSKKSRRALLFDYAVVGSIQLAAFIYGLYAVANTRPVYIVSVGDRIEVVSAGEIDDADLAQGCGSAIASDRDGDRSSSESGARGSEGARQDAVFRAGRQGLPRAAAYYVPYEQNLPEIRQQRCR